MRLSFIIPFYNGKKYIKECIDSLYQQDIPINEYEVLIVDDCSNDGESRTLLTTLEAKYPNMHIIHNERNSRCGESRNHGVREAKGKYVWFVDQDDYIVPNCLSILLDICESGQLDILTFDYRNVSDDLTLNTKKNLIKTNSIIQTGLDYIQNICQGDFWNAEYDTNVWHSLFRRQFLLDNEIFSPEISYCEDMIVTLHAIILAKRHQAVSNDYYCYRYNPQSVFHTEVGVKGRPIFDASIFAGSEIALLSQLIPQDYQELRDIVYQGGVGRINSFTKAILKIKAEERNCFYEQVKLHPDIISQAFPFLSQTNKWLLNHPQWVKTFPYVFYFYVKILC